MTWRERPIVVRLRHRVALVRAWWRRSRRLPLAIRGAVWLTGVAALAVAVLPLARQPGLLVVIAPLALIPAARPAGGGPGLLIAAAVLVLAAWQLMGAPVSLVQVAVLAAVLYLHHTAAALAAAVRTDAVVPAAVVWHWLRRTGLVLLVAAPVGAAMVALAARAPAGPATPLVVAAALATVGVVATLVLLRYRRPDADAQ